MAPRRNRVQLTTNERYEILQMIDRGVTFEIIAKAYGIGRSTVGDIMANEGRIKDYLEVNTMVRRWSPNHLIKSRHMDLERVLYLWYIRCKAKRVRITGPLIRKKALELNEELNGDPNFKASSGWLLRFRVRHRIRKRGIREDIRTSNKDAANNFKARFKKLLQDEGFTLENVYNADYRELMWRAVPKEALIFRNGKSTGIPKMCQDHITTLFCANATGCHKLPVLIHTFVKPQSSHNLNANLFSTIYTDNTNARMDSNIFNQWFEKCFLKSVKERQLKNGRREKTLLLLDHVGSRHDLKELNQKDEFVRVMSFPFKAAPLIQPMDRGIIACFKRKYRKELLETLMPLPICNTEQEVIDNHKQLTLRDCCRIVHDAWSSVNEVILKNAWDILLKNKSERSAEDLETIKKDVDETVALLHRLPGCEGCNRKGVVSWFQIDETDDTVMTICTDEVLQDFEYNPLNQVNIGTVDEEDEPSHSWF
ncbi:jerky protein homolog-like [Bombus bifarius]|uniref:Jerky protein homolog-like n=2 Tax=Bombus bifarius TaxID=103933 RepID=A0A6P8ML49_9HYME|nr:jerky protein homolog-like [Bombus vancouverensis nearcticus]XP_033314511.1 jerky protein homolog-like [Bombus bifarius]